MYVCMYVYIYIYIYLFIQCVYISIYVNTEVSHMYIMYVCMVPYNSIGSKLETFEFRAEDLSIQSLGVLGIWWV